MASNYTLSTSIYLLNGKDFSTFGADVETSSGFLDMPKRKPVLQNNWPQEHGLDIDLDAGYFLDSKPLRVTLLLQGSTYKDLQLKRSALLSELEKPGYQVLKMAGIPQLFQVICTESVVFEMLTNVNAAPAVCKITLSLTNPFPKTRQFYAVNPASISFEINTSKPVTIDWGDGNKTYADKGTSTKAHNYIEAGTYCAIIYGGVDGISSLVCNGVETIESLLTA